MNNKNHKSLDTKANIVIGVTGGISAYKAVELTRLLIKSGHNVFPVLTSSALKMVGKKTFDALATEPAKTDMWEDEEVSPHTYLGQKADLILVCPATARIISDISTGRSADLLATTILASEAPVIVCPAMHTEMWMQESVQENIEILKARSIRIVEPEEGELAGGDIGVGRLAGFESILTEVNDVLNEKNTLKGVSVLVTAGATREPIDAVRYITNKSTGKQGHAIAEAAMRMGAEVTLVTSSNISSPEAIKRIDVNTAEEMRLAVLENIKDTELFIMAAAVADFTPSSPTEKKIKKINGVPEINLKPTADILKEVAQVKSSDQIIVGFAAETDSITDNALKKLKEKDLDFIIANDVLASDAGFAYDTNAVTVFSSEGSQVEFANAQKTEIARLILDLVWKER